ncbi:hypothetical protein A3H10_03305 [Candidatus Uhrbacteria bacterium RIFCSPLOWO2_12_FULL_46_10]|uniref:Baseplate protein J-like domain-containing protein n=1 Tax=Candidatus Uhrbacteria bacterium RIFCSPLOWO2_01_FULL_47_25 TaxID=1802402 RepID=A0A1F7UWV7_9BACT|nr:MAG: hypothetical protein A2752_03960 [Candidatus Uhrbacteria bacterium RIFCSPHIGHO2_01_FULL_46_23]OGL70034.1 MAG: hypothetical protein A3D60_05125 [Candidatus Uhrbacteria bacterium RIFCSPHIGHO2_02_FULL_47_29]OGL76623.1 MAG: hypothetical protein A3E96_00555 [Candidatus Uhrbacteria bacterium RIFCSPHIGHO2_12_FULL_46_13]OGL82783.1 MAG: hypothetical protein A2936_05615 [Candidatus Uhrbacteria bacterium RIFCSPLOWO2_01_FULL_47_25]OGL85194.1 MAG: hypothetical protein A3I37_01565 [Candidatus Uhrbact
MSENYMNEQMNLPRPSRVLRKMAITFIVLTAILLTVVGYMAFSRARIIVTLGSVNKEYYFRLILTEDVFGRERPGDSIAALFLETTESASDTFIPTGGGERVGKAGGVVTLRNETDRPQPLVATTRLLTPEGVLFRLKEGVYVPARGTVTATAEADKEGKDGEIGPARFIIPGLSPSLQLYIYATSEVGMIRGGALAKTVTEQDLETARQTLRQKLLERTRQSFAAQVGEDKITPQDFITDIIEEKSSAKTGEAASSFTLETRIKIIGVVFDKQEMIKQAIKDISSQNSGVSTDNIRYTIDNFNSIERTASLSGRAVIKSVLDKQSSIFAVDNFTGWTVEGVKSFLDKYEGIENVEVQISPYWQRHLPRIPSRIKVEFKGG